MGPRGVYLVSRGWFGFCFRLVTTTSLVYMVVDAGLDPLQMVLVGTVLELSALVLEVPTGVVADRWSRKWSVVVGQSLTGLGFVLLALVPEFWAILLAQLIWGFGYTFISGAFPAWLSDEIGVDQANAAIIRGARLVHLFGLLGIVAAVVLAHWNLSLPILFGGAGFIALGVLLALTMRETVEWRTAVAGAGESRGITESFWSAVDLVKSQRVLVLILLVAVVMGMFSEGIDRLNVPYLIENFELPTVGPFDAVIWWGLIAAVVTLVSLAATTVAERVVDVNDHRKLSAAMAVCTLGMGAAVLAFATLPWLLAVLVALWVSHGFRAAADPLQITWLNRLVPSRHRATLLSMQGQADCVGQAGVGPLLGLLAREVSIATALITSALLLTPAAFLYRRLAALRDPNATG